MKELPVRKHPRLKGYDYSQNGAYFITFCVKDKHEMLGRIDVGRVLRRTDCIPDAPIVELSGYGKALKDAIEFLNNNKTKIDISNYVIMPNHVHLIVMIESVHNGASGMQSARWGTRPTNALIPKLVSSIKRFTNKQAGFNIWQQSYYDHIIRDEAEYQRIWQYIDENPSCWVEDDYYTK